MSGGLVVSLLLFGITWVQVNARLQAQHDTLELHRSEAALAAEKELLDVTLNSIADGVITTDTAGKIISVNQSRGIPDRLAALRGGRQTINRGFSHHPR